MKYLLSNTSATTLEFTTIAQLSEYLDKSHEYWLGGSGASSIEINNDERLIFFKTISGFVILYHPNYEVPLIDTNKKIPEYKEHYIGGDKFEYPDTCLCNKATALRIFELYITTGKLSNEFDWVDIYGFENAPEF